MPFKVGDRVTVSGTEDDSVWLEHLGLIATVYGLGPNYNPPHMDLGRDYRVRMDDGCKYTLWEKKFESAY